MVEKRGLAPLAHPLFWTALVVLAVNDHLLKGAGVLPGVVTGKLSDFAGLIVAPVLVASALRWHTTLARVMAFAAVVSVFGAIKLSADAARIVESAVSVLGVEWRIWTDPTDLFALSVLPLAWWLLDARAALPHRKIVERVALVAGALACVATSEPPPMGPPTMRTFYVTTAFIANHTGGPLDVRVRWLDAEVDCNAVRADVARALHADAFGVGTTFAVDTDGVLPLERTAAWSSLGLTADSLGTRPFGCDAALIQVDGLDATIAFWATDLTMEIPANARDTLGHASAVEIHGARDGLVAMGNVSVLAVLYAEEVDAPACDAGEPVAFGVSALDVELTGGPLLLEAAEIGPDGCTRADVVTTRGNARQIYFCIPDWAFPFAPGTELAVQSDTGLILVRGTDAAGVSHRVEVYLQIDAHTIAPASIYAEDLPCGGFRGECGSFEILGGVRVPGHDELVLPGGTIDLVPELDGMSGRLMLGRAATTIVSPRGCDDAEPMTPRYDLLLMEVGP